MPKPDESVCKSLCKKGTLLAVCGLCLVLIKGCGRKESVQQTEKAPQAQVCVRVIKPENRKTEATLRGTVAAWRKTTLCARTQGTVMAIKVDRGACVKNNDVIVVLSADDRREKLAEAKSNTAAAKLEYKAVQSLSEEDYQSRLMCSQKKAAQERAIAQEKAAHLNSVFAGIRAPFDGQVYERLIEIGDAVSVGTKIASVADLSTMRIIAYCSEKDYNIAQTATSVTAHIKGRELPAKIVSLVSVADPCTRMYRMDVQVTNDGSIADGMTAEVCVEGQEQVAHYIPSSALCLSDEGRTGIKTLNASGKVCFSEVQILSLDAKGAWISGLEGPIKMIIIGQDFVSVDQIPVVQEEQ